MTVYHHDDDWKKFAACSNLPTELFIEEWSDEPNYPPSEVKKICDACPVKPECLAYALKNDEVGTWGGTSSYQRRQLKTVHGRAKCPGCASTDMIMEHNVQVCLACGVSWPII
jgi:WhiB family redox-sensing transcriptional regulator